MTIFMFAAVVVVTLASGGLASSLGGSAQMRTGSLQLGDVTRGPVPTQPLPDGAKLIAAGTALLGIASALRRHA